MEPPIDKIVPEDIALVVEMVCTWTCELGIMKCRNMDRERYEELKEQVYQSYPITDFHLARMIQGWGPSWTEKGSRERRLPAWSCNDWTPRLAPGRRDVRPGVLDRRGQTGRNVWWR